MLKSQIDASVLCSLQWKFIPRPSKGRTTTPINVKYTKQCIRSKINDKVPVDRDSRMQTLQSPGVVLSSMTVMECVR